MPRRLISESVARTIEAEGWGSPLDLGRIDEARNDRLQRLMGMIKSRHFGIVSPHRSFAQQDEKGQKLPEKDVAIYKGDQTAAKMVGAKTWGGKSGLRAGHNAEAWQQLKGAVARLGLKPLRLVGAFPEKGGAMATEASLMLPGQGQGGTALSVATMTNLARRYNQDGFIYAGPETNGEVHLFEVSARGKSGLPTAYGNHFSIGAAESPSDIKKLVQRLGKPSDEQGIQGLTQPTGHGEKDPGRPAAKVTLGKGKGTTFT